jgi:hypothetical protein
MPVLLWHQSFSFCTIVSQPHHTLLRHTSAFVARLA